MGESSPDFSIAAYLLPRINREGRKFGIAALAVAAAAALGAVAVAAGGTSSLLGVWLLRFPTMVWTVALAVLSALLFLLAYGVFLFFRDPDRYPPDDAKAVLSPADGRVCLVQECELPDSIGEMEEFRGRRFWRVSVFMSVFNVHVNRMPTAGEILKKEYVAAGRFLNASLDKASKENERCNYLVRAENGQTYVVTQIAGLVARRIVPQASDGDRLERAARFGLIRFGSRLDVYLPDGVKPEVRPGQTMVAGETVLGHLT